MGAVSTLSPSAAGPDRHRASSSWHLRDSRLVLTVSGSSGHSVTPGSSRQLPALSVSPLGPPTADPRGGRGRCYPRAGVPLRASVSDG